MRIFVALCLAATFAQPATAQTDPNAQAYAETLRAALDGNSGGLEADFNAYFPVLFPGGEAEPLLSREAVIATITLAQGDWMMLNRLMADGVFDPEMLERGCGVSADRLTVTSDFSFDLTSVSRGELTSATVSYTHVNNLTFTKTADVDGIIARLFPDRARFDESDAMFAQILSGPAYHGYSQVRLLSPDLMLIQHMGLMPMLFGRCPS